MKLREGFSMRVLAPPTASVSASPRAVVRTHERRRPTVVDPLRRIAAVNAALSRRTPC
jgi:hypothetical protein